MCINQEIGCEKTPAAQSGFDTAVTDANRSGSSLPGSFLQALLDELRQLVRRFLLAGVPEDSLYEELVGEAEGWKLRLEEINHDGDVG